MRKTIKKTLALLLTALMLFGTAIPMVSATEATSESTFKDPATAQNGDILWEVNFKDTERFNVDIVKNKDDYSELKISDDGKTAELIAKSRDVVANYGFGGAIQGLPMGDGNGAYTVEFKMSAYNGGTSSAGLKLVNSVYANSKVTSGFGLSADSALNAALISRCKDYTPTAKIWISGTHLKNIGRVEETKTDSLGVSNRVYTYRLTVDNKTGTTALYVLDSSVGWACLDTQTDYTSSDEYLNLVFAIQNAATTTRALTVSDVKIFKGIFETITTEAYGSELISLGNMSEAQTFSNGIIYTPTINFTSNANYAPNYSFDVENAEHTISDASLAAYHIRQYGGVTNLRLGYGQKYTVTYSIKQPVAGLAAGFAFATPGNSTRRAISVTMTQTKLNMRLNGAASSVGNSFNSSVSYDSTIFADNGYAHVAIEFDNYQITVYINGDKKITYDALANSGNGLNGYGTANLSLAFLEYADAAATTGTTYKNVKVYSGLTVSNKYVTVVDGETTEKLAIPATETYTLPTREAAAGYVFKGWKVNDADFATPAGTSVLTNDLERIEAVYAKAMSDVWVQFGNTDTENNTTDMRIVGVLDSLYYNSIGYDIVIKYKVNEQEQTYTSANYELHNVYNSLLAKYGTEVVTPETLGFGADSGYYLTAFTIFNVPTNIGEITFELTPYQIDLDGNKMPGEKITLSFTEMWAKNNASGN